MQCVKYVISGRVQGVGFRWSTKRKASELNLSGYVRNLSSGDVEALVCGDKYTLDKFSEWISSGGPKFSSIKDFSAQSVDLEELPESFVIKETV